MSKHSDFRKLEEQCVQLKKNREILADLVAGVNRLQNAMYVSIMLDTSDLIAQTDFCDDVNSKKLYLLADVAPESSIFLRILLAQSVQPVEQ